MLRGKSPFAVCIEGRGRSRGPQGRETSRNVHLRGGARCNCLRDAAALAPVICGVRGRGRCGKANLSGGLRGGRWIRSGLTTLGGRAFRFLVSKRDSVDAGTVLRGCGSAAADGLCRIRNARRACGFSKEIGRESYRQGNGDGDEHEFEDGAAAVGVHREGGFEPGAGQYGEEEAREDGDGYGNRGQT